MNCPTTRPLASFLTRLIWLSVLPPLIAAAWLAGHNVLSMRDASRQQAANTSKNFATSIDHYLSSRIKALNILAVSPLVDDPQSWPKLYAEAQGFFDNFNSHVILTDIDQPMGMLFNTRIPFGAPLPPLPRPKGHAAAPTALSTGIPAVGDTFMGPIAKEPLVAIAVPAKRDGKVVHLLLTTLEARLIQQRLDLEALPAAWSLTLRDGKGDIIAQRTSADFDPSQKVDNDGRFEVESKLSPWKVVLEIPRDALLKPLVSNGFFLALAVTLATMAGVLGGTLASRRLGRQVAGLTAPPSADSPPIDIEEIAAARQLLDEAATSQRLNESRYQAMFENASIGIAQVALDGPCLQVNQTVCAMFGYSRDELRTRTWQQLTPPDELPTDLNYVARLIAGDLVSYQREKRFKARDDSLFWANLGVTLIRKPDGTPDYFIAIVEHIQARKDAEAALIERDALLTDMGAMTHVGGWFFDPTTGKGQWTPEAARIHDLADDKPIDAATGLSFYTEKHRPIIEAAIQEATRETKPYDLELEILTSAGRHKWVRTIGHPVVKDGQVVRLRGAIQDITKYKELVEELKQRNEELEGFNRATVGRELQMIELKQQINELSRQLGQEPPFDLSFVEVSS